MAASEARVSPCGRSRPGGGIMPARSFVIIRSATAGVDAAPATSKPSSTRSPECFASLWQPPHVRCTTAVSVSSEIASPGARLATAKSAARMADGTRAA